MNTQEVLKLAGEVAKKHGVACAKELVVELLVPALDAAVAASPSKIDDAVVAYLGPVIKAELIKLLDGIK